MTVIALFEDYQLAISDALITVNDRAISTITPTTGDTALISDLEHGVSRLVRKVITANGPVGRAELLVAGTVTHIEYFASTLHKIFRDQRHLPEELLELVRKNGAYGCFEAAALIANANGRNEFEAFGVAGNRMCAHTFDANRIFTEIPYFGNVWIAGSGATNLLTWLELRGTRYASHYSNLNASERRFHIANNIPLFLMEEDTSPRRRTINNGVGGYYEAHAITAGKFTPVDDCLTVFADLIGKTRDISILIRRLMYHCYRDDHLYVFSVKHDITLSAASPTNISLSECTFFEVVPLNPRAVLSKWTIHRVATQIPSASILRTVMRKDEGGPITTRRFISAKPNYPRLLKITLSGGALSLEIDPQGFRYFASRFSDDPSEAILV